MPSADPACIGDGKVWNAEELRLSDSAIPSDTRDDLDDASNANNNSSGAMENAFYATYEAHSFGHHEDLRVPGPTVDEQGTPSKQEIEGKPVEKLHFGEQRRFEPAHPSDAGLDAGVRQSTRKRRPPTGFGDYVNGHAGSEH